MFDKFHREKKIFLSKIDKSKKGQIDKEIFFLVNKINSFQNYYTTSSCAGRIIILKIPKSERKNETKKLFISHRKVNFSEIKKVLKNIPKEKLWFRYEPAIFHISCRTIDDAQKIINAARSVGFKKSGIQATRKKISVEVSSSDIIDTIIATNGNLVVDDSYLKILIDEANKKMKRNKKKLKKFYEILNRI